MWEESEGVTIMTWSSNRGTISTAMSVEIEIDARMNKTFRENFSKHSLKLYSTFVDPTVIKFNLMTK